MNTFDMVAESNAIEGITRAPTVAEVREHERFVALEAVSITELQNFVKVYEPNARLRSMPGLDVRIGSYVSPRGGEQVLARLQSLVTAINAETISAWQAHTEYESLHPFTDCNGRSGRILFYFMFVGSQQVSLGFLHAFYYQTLQNCQTP